MTRYEVCLNVEKFKAATAATDDELAYYLEHDMLPVIQTKNYGAYFRANAIEAIRFIRRAQRLSFSVDEIKTMLSTIEHLGGTEQIASLVAEKIDKLRGEVTRMVRLERDLLGFERRCRDELNSLAVTATWPVAAPSQH